MSIIDQNINTNVPEVIARMNHNVVIRAASEYLKSGNKKIALEAFKNSVSGDKIKIGDLENATSQEILAELSL